MTAASHLIVVDRALMADTHDEHDEPILLNGTDDSRVANAITPQAELASTKGFSEVTRITCSSYPVLQLVKDLALRGLI
jgi:hypothetical protein